MVLPPTVIILGVVHLLSQVPTQTVQDMFSSTSDWVSSLYRRRGENMSVMPSTETGVWGPFHLQGVFHLQVPLYYEIPGKYQCLFQDLREFLSIFICYTDQKCLDLYMCEAVIHTRDLTGFFQTPPCQTNQTNYLFRRAYLICNKDGWGSKTAL